VKVSGFTIIRNAIKFSYPVVESICSILPLCDEMIVMVGNSEDETLALIESIGDAKIRIHHSVWDSSLRQGGKVLAVETNKAYDKIDPASDWAFYIQADEVVHEQYLERIFQGMRTWKDHREVEGLLFKFLHFYGTYGFIADSRRWYRNEIRIVRNDKRIRSYKDAQGFRKSDCKLKVKPLDAYIYHYGWVKHPAVMKTKKREVSRLWHDDRWVEQNYDQSPLFDFSKIDSLDRFTGTHPVAMQARLNEETSHIVEQDAGRKNFKLKDHLLYQVEKITGYRPFEYKNYRLI
jgi:glycosyltransferase involved in cell wall biosynthesis